MKPKIPFNIDILVLDRQKTAGMIPVTSVDMFEGFSRNFHDEGLYSTRIFGDVGTEERDYTFSYIDLKTKIINPIMYERIVKLKALYGEIMNGTRYAEWDDQLKDFVPSTPLEGDTGYAFFIKYLPLIKFQKNNSPRRNIMIDIINKYRSHLLMDRFLVLPAGLRDLTVDETGRTTEDEINEMYRRLIAIANSLHLLSGGTEEGLDVPRRNLQNTVQQIYRYLHSVIDDKKGFAQARFGSRNVVNGTRNVLSPMDTSAEVSGGLRAPSIHHVFSGLYQTMKGVLPLTIHRIRKHPLYQHAFTQDEEYINLVNPKTLKSERVNVDQSIIDKWQSVEGIEKLIHNFGNAEHRYRYISINGYYLGLIYKDKEKFMILKDIDELPEGWNKDNVQPIRYIEFYYAALYEVLYRIKGMVTRYPVSGMGSTYVCEIYTKTTTNSLPLQEYVDGYKVEENGIAREFPYVREGEEPSYFQTMSPHTSRLGGLGADFDGDSV